MHSNTHVGNDDDNGELNNLNQGKLDSIIASCVRRAVLSISYNICV